MQPQAAQVTSGACTFPRASPSGSSRPSLPAWRRELRWSARRPPRRHAQALCALPGPAEARGLIPASVPGHYVTLDDAHPSRLLVRGTVTGAVTATVSAPAHFLLNAVYGTRTGRVRIIDGYPNRRRPAAAVACTCSAGLRGRAAPAGAGARGARGGAWPVGAGAVP